MTLRIDSSRAFRTYEELEALVRAVMAANEHDETSWLEWKSKLDLSTKDGQFAVARTILGLSNRSVEDAVRQCDGCGYLIVGADHAGLHGVSTVDLTVLEQGLAPYLGRGVGTPRWSPRYIDPGGKWVLVVTVEAPRPGDRIHTLRKANGSIPAGAVLVRGKAKTEVASPGELALLEERLLAGTREPIMDLEVTTREMEWFHPVQPPDNAEVEAWIARRVKEIWDEAPAAAKPQLPVQNLFGITGPDYSFLLGSMAPVDDQRRRFERLVAKYEEDCRRVLPQAMVSGVVESGDNKLAVRVSNRTESILTAVTLVAEFDASTAEIYVAPPKEGRLPREPAWQDASPTAWVRRYPRSALANMVAPSIGPGAVFVDQDNETVRMTWRFGDLHVRQAVTGEQITLIPAWGWIKSMSVGMRPPATARGSRKASGPYMPRLTVRWGCPPPPKNWRLRAPERWCGPPTGRPRPHHHHSEPLRRPALASKAVCSRL